MSDERKSGILLIAGALGSILTMAIHPSGAHSLTPDQVRHLMLASGIAHSLGIASFVLLFLGACGLTRSIAAADRISFAAIVVYGFACAAIFIAATVSGFIIPAIWNRMDHDVPTAASQWRIVMSGIFQINQAFAGIYTVLASIAIILWSISALRNGGLGRGTAIYGCIIAPLIILGICIGHLRLDVHGMAAVVLGHGIWIVLVGYQLYSRPVSPRSPQ